MRARRVRLFGAGLAAQREFGTEHRAYIQFNGGFGEPHRPVQAVVIGQRQRTQIQPGGLLDQFLRRTGPVEEAVRRMRMQFGVCDGGADPLPVRFCFI